MTCAPCFEASWAACSCFWIIDSLSPVQVAWTSAPRTLRAMWDPSSVTAAVASVADGEGRVHRDTTPLHVATSVDKSPLRMSVVVMALTASRGPVRLERYRARRPLRGRPGAQDP